jgi:hypothetical protein
MAGWALGKAEGTLGGGQRLSERTPQGRNRHSRAFSKIEAEKVKVGEQKTAEGVGEIVVWRNLATLSRHTRVI